jgi:hypothetical protein
MYGEVAEIEEGDVGMNSQAGDGENRNQTRDTHVGG